MTDATQMPNFLKKLQGELPEERAKAREMVERDEDAPEREDEVWAGSILS